MDKIIYNFARLRIEGNELQLILDDFSELFKAYKIHGSNSKATISGYITAFNMMKLREKVQTFATVNVYVEELITC